jgi:DNA-directed RNA polymerase specialized sigma24 family protein
MRSTRERVFRELYAAHGPAVRAYLARRVEPQYVDDLASETFMVAWRKLPDDVEEPLAWLYAVARREVMAHRRHDSGRMRLAERLAALTPRHEGIAVLPLVGPALDPPLAHAFARLTDNEKEALLLVAWEGLDHAQAGRVVGCSAATFTVRLSRARAKLRAALTPSQPSVAREGTA